MPEEEVKEDLRRYLPSRNVADKLARGDVWKTPPTPVNGTPAKTGAAVSAEATRTTARPETWRRRAVICTIAAATVLVPVVVLLVLLGPRRGTGSGDGRSLRERRRARLRHRCEGWRSRRRAATTAQPDATSSGHRERERPSGTGTGSDRCSERDGKRCGFAERNLHGVTDHLAASEPGPHRDRRAFHVDVDGEARRGANWGPASDGISVSDGAFRFLLPRSPPPSPKPVPFDPLMNE